MAQEILIFFIFALAAGYLLRLGYATFFSKDSGCAKGCGSACSTIDLKKIEQQMRAKQMQSK
jgi:hypothetical protein